MNFFTVEEFEEKYTDFQEETIPNWKIEAVSEMIFSQVGLLYRGDGSFNETTVPFPIKNAAMEQLRFMLEYDIPFIDTREMRAGEMSAKTNSDYSTLALRILANHGYLYRGNPISTNMGISIPFGG